MKFNNCRHEMAKLFEDISVLELKKIWDPTDTSYFIGDTDRLSATGFKKYWEAVDRSVQYCDTTVMVKKKIKYLQTRNSFLNKVERELLADNTSDISHNRSYDHLGGHQTHGSSNQHKQPGIDRFHWR